MGKKWGRKQLTLAVKVFFGSGSHRERKLVCRWKLEEEGKVKRGATSSQLGV